MIDVLVLVRTWMLIFQPRIVLTLAAWLVGEEQRTHLLRQRSTTAAPYCYKGQKRRGQSVSLVLYPGGRHR